MSRSYVMAKYAIVLLSACWCQTTSAQAFEDFFAPVDTIALSTDVLIGEVHAMDVDADGRLLILDRLTWLVSLFEPDGRFVTTLSVEECNPGFEMNPMGAYFNGDEIFLINSGIWGYRFHRDGTCKGPVDDSFRPAQHVATRPHADAEVDGGRRAGSLFLLRATPVSYGLVEFDHTGKLVREFETLDEFPRYTNRSGIKYTMATDRSIYLIRSFRPTALEYSNDGARIREIGSMPENFRQINEDFPDIHGDLPAIMKAGGRMMAEYSSVIGAGMLDDGIFAVMYTARPRGRKPRLYAYDLAGNVTIPPVEMNRYPFYIGRGRLYTIDVSELTDDEEANPRVVVYARKE